MRALRTRPGMTLLISVLILGAVAISVGASMAIRGIEEVDVGRSTVQTSETLAVAEGCIEEAMIQLKRTAGNFSGTTLSIGDGVCSVSVAGTLPNLALHATGTVLQWTREVYVNLTLQGSSITEVEWEHDPPSSVPTCDPGTAPSCNGFTATVYVDDCNTVSGGPDDGLTYTGTLNGTNGADVMVATSGVDIILADNGADTICGLGGNDVINAGNGNDNIFGGAGDDVINGDAQSDTICAGPGHDTVNGDDQADSIDGGEGTDIVDGGNQNDVCRNAEFPSNCEDTTSAIALCGVAGISSAPASSSAPSSAASSGPASSSASSGGAASSNPSSAASSGGAASSNPSSAASSGGGGASSSPSSAASSGGGGPSSSSTASSWASCPMLVPPKCNGLSATVYVDTCLNLIVGGPDDGQIWLTTLNGTTGNDVMVGTSGTETINGNNGNDVICARAGADTINAGAGDDIVFGENGDDVIDGANGDDIICAGLGYDTITGGNQADSIDGGIGIDDINGENSTDICRNGETLTSCEDTTSGIPTCGVDAAGSSSAAPPSSSTSS